MGLDQYAYTRESREKRRAFLEKAGNGDAEAASMDAYREADDLFPDAFYWRKHAKLQEFFEARWTGDEEFNCVDFELTPELIAELESCLTGAGLPDSQGGFFYGHQFQDESAKEYHEQDLQFCKWAREKIEAGETPVYSCWW